ncbi:MAG: putative transposase [Chitinophagaceae bacterium]
MATTRYEERIAAATTGTEHAPVRFESHQGVCGAGVLFLLPTLLSQGLLKTKEVYEVPSSHYYGLESVVLTLAFMALAHIKNPEQLKQCKPGEIGKIIGLDRIPEVRCLRDKIKLLVAQKQARQLNRILIDHWYEQPGEESSFLYIDGHVRIYYGNQANLPVKYVSRQKLCLSATTEYWVNDAEGLPVMMVMGELTEKLEQVIEEQIIPELKKTVLLPRDNSINEDGQQNKQSLPTLIFDREAYHPAFFHRLWTDHRIPVITYRKNVKDKWPEESFVSMDATVLNQTITMRICEQRTTLSGFGFREIRRLSGDGHQTSIITTNEVISTSTVAGRMFGRWSQENFFRYLIADYDFDKMINFGVETIDETKEVVNPPYRRINYKLKKQREKMQRLKAKLYPLAEQIMEAPVEAIPTLTQQQINIREKIDVLEKEDKQILEQRNNIPARITLKNMPEQQRYNKLYKESKMMMNIIKMICYRAETAVANLLKEHLANAKDEKRMVVKQIIESNADIITDLENNTLTITLHSLSANRFNFAAAKLAELLNQTQTIFPGSDLRLIFKTTASSHCDG